MQIDPDALKIMYRLIRHGHKAFLVGGGVRDLLLNKKPKDFDISTDATPRKIKSIFRNSRIIGRRFKLAHVFFRGNKIIEVSTFRDASDSFETTEGESAASGDENARAPTLRDNIYGTETTDALRRDITINGLFYDLATFSIIDYVGGMEDLRNGIIRVIGDPDLRFREDPVRLVRVVRHAARSGFQIDERCWQSLRANTPLIQQASEMRVFEELKKDFVSGNLLQILRLMGECGLLTHLLPGVAHDGVQALRDGFPLADAVSRIDQFVKQGNPPTVTSILVSIVLLHGAEPEWLAHLDEHFPDEEALREQIADTFVSLAVPRKERERIEAVLGTWYWLTGLGEERLKSVNLSRRSNIEDLKWLLRIVETPKHEALLTAIAGSTGAPPRHDQRRPRRRRGNRRRGGDNARATTDRNM